MKDYPTYLMVPVTESIMRLSLLAGAALPHFRKLAEMKVVEALASSAQVISDDRINGGYTIVVVIDGIEQRIARQFLGQLTENQLWMLGIDNDPFAVQAANPNPPKEEKKNRLKKEPSTKPNERFVN